MAGGKTKFSESQKSQTSDKGFDKYEEPNSETMRNGISSNDLCGADR